MSSKISEVAIDAASDAYAKERGSWSYGLRGAMELALKAALPYLQGEAVPVAWQSMATCPRDGSVVLLRWGEDHVSPGWWCAPVSPIQNDDGTWPPDTGGFPWAFFDTDNGRSFVNHAVDTKYGPTQWAEYHPQPAELNEVSGNSGELNGWAIAEKVRTDLDRQSCPDAYMRIAVESVVKHLAATGKQQVGEVHADAQSHIEALEAATHWSSTSRRFKAALLAGIEALAPRQPVGAQGVDLGQFREAVELLEWVNGGHNNPEWPTGDAEKHAAARKLLSLIDSQRCVTPGEGNG